MQERANNEPDQMNNTTRLKACIASKYRYVHELRERKATCSHRSARSEYTPECSEIVKDNWLTGYKKMVCLQSNDHSSNMESGIRDQCSITG